MHFALFSCKMPARGVDSYSLEAKVKVPNGETERAEAIAVLRTDIDH